MSLAEADLFSDVRRVANRELLKPVRGFARQYRGRIAVLLVLCTLSTAFALIQPFFFRAIIDAALSQRSRRVGGPVISGGNLAALTFLLFGVGALNVVFSLAVTRYQSSLSHQMLLNLQTQLYDRVQRMPYGFFIHANPGAVVNRINTEASFASFALPNVLNGGFTALLSLISGVALMAVYDWRLLLVVIFLTAFVIPSKWIRRRVHSQATHQLEAQSVYMGMMHERLSVSGALLTRLFGQHERNLRTFTKETTLFRDLGIDIAWWQGVGQSIITLGTVIGLAGIAWFAGNAVASGALTVGTLALLFFYVRILSIPIQSYGNIRFELTRGLVAFGRIFEIRDFPAVITFPPDSESCEPLEGSLEFRNVSFRYTDPSVLAPPSLRYLDAQPEVDKNDVPALVLEDVSFRVEPGQFVALVGSSGAGKSTVAALAARLFDVSDGSVLIGGTELRQVPERQLVKSVGLVTQDTLLFHDTIRNNLLVGRPDATDKELVRACVAAGIHQFIRSLPAGYGTIVGERGVRLSGGQRQRLAFARIVLLDPSIIILDEATAHLDAESESLLREAIESVLAGRTRLVIAHRLSTILDADEILVLEGGRIVERGHHGELMAAGGRYRQLYQTQLLRMDHASALPPPPLEVLDVTP